MGLVRYGVIGCGMMGQEHLRAIKLLPETEIAAIYEPDDAMASAAHAIAPRARIASDLQSLLGDQELDCVLIASPNHIHVDHLEAVARHRAIPVLVEKPLFVDPSEGLRVEAFAKSYPAPIWVAMEYRYMPPVAEFLDLAETVTGGLKMLTIREHRYPFLDKVGGWNRFNRMTGGTFVEKCCHFFDLMRLVLNSEPVRVMASGAQDVNHRDERIDGNQPDVFDNGFVLVEFENGARAMLDLCMFAEGAPYQEELCAVGPKGKIEAFIPGPARFWPVDGGRQPLPKVVESPRNPSGQQIHEVPVDSEVLEIGDHNGSTFYQHVRFLELVRGERAAPDVTLRDGKQAVLMGQAAHLSVAERRCVSMSELA